MGRNFVTVRTEYEDGRAGTAEVADISAGLGEVSSNIKLELIKSDKIGIKLSNIQSGNSSKTRLGPLDHDGLKILMKQLI